MKAELTQIQKTYDFEYKGKHYSITETWQGNPDFTDYLVYDEQGFELGNKKSEEIFEAFIANINPF
uniref:Uncharacterized protein n=1 Tax=viral metagenome TaxID=1070528 RepID=A0A6H2A2M0_9ZZZZ